MSTILVANEFGGGFGHINRLLAVAKRLDPRHKLVFAVPSVEAYRAVIEKALAAPPEILEGVAWRPPSGATSGGVTHVVADTLHVYGYAEQERLLAASLRWMAVLARASPDLIIADAAPTLRLISQPRIPTVVLGSGYGVPPAAQPLAPIRPWATSVPANNRAHEAQLLAASNLVRDTLQEASVDFFADLFHGERTFVCTIPELDPYARARVEPQTWPFNMPSMPREFPAERDIVVFAYLPGGHPAINEILAAIKALDVPSELYISNADPHAVSRQSSRKTRIHVKPADLAAILPRTRILIHSGGLGTTFAGLVAGVPQLLFPNVLEQSVTARGLEQFGCSRRVEQRFDGAAVKNALEQMLADPTLLPAAARTRQQLEARRVRDPVAGIVAACESLI
jgi:UDP:flavonoid glycosyltransferase YjiC (YdhE family)